MDYKQAKNIRNKSFGTLLAEQEGGLGHSIKSAISQKTQAKITGLKEKFDPLNIAKTLTGGSTWAPALLGKMFNMNQNRINYFTGAKNKTTQLSGGDSIDSPEVIDCLGYIYKSLKQSIEDKKISLDEKLNRLEEEDSEEELRNQEIVKALTARFGKKKPEKEKPYRDEKGRFAKKPTEEKQNLGKETPKSTGGKTQTKPMETKKVETPKAATPTGKTPIVPSSVSKGIGIGAVATAGALTISKIIEVGKGYNIVQLASGETVRREGSWNWRNNNPGNIEYGEYALKNGAIPFEHGMPKSQKPEERFAVFPTYEIGRKAKENLIFEGKNYKDLTIDQAISRYAPPTENNTAAYQQAVKSALNLPAEKLQVLKMRDLTPEQRSLVLSAMEKQEGYGSGKKQTTIIQKGPNPTNNEINSGNRIDKASSELRDNKADASSKDKSAPIVNSTNVSSQQQQSAQSPTQGDDTNAYQKKSKGKV